MRLPAPLAVGLLLCLGAVAGGCREGAKVPDADAAQPPTWTVARDEGDRERLLIDVYAPSACRVLLRMEGVREPRSTETLRTFAAGETARLAIRAEVEDAARPNATAPQPDAEAGRTDAWIAQLEHAWDLGSASRRSEVVGTRPGQGRSLGRWLAIPPRQPTALPFGQDVDLACVAIADGGADATLEGRESGSRVRGTFDPKRGERATLLRVVLRAERLQP